jgi:transcriptional regulator with XRE-family HTH domain
MDLKDRIKILLESKRVTPYEVSRETGISQATLSRLINGQTAKLSIKNKAVLANYFHVEPEELITGSGSIVKTNCTEILSDNNKSHPELSVIQDKDINNNSNNDNKIAKNKGNIVIGSNNMGGGNITHNHKTQCDQLQNLINEMDKRMYAQTEDFQHQAAAFQEQIKSFQDQIKEKDEYIRDVIKKKHESNQNHERQMADLRHQNAQLLEHNGKLIDENSRLTHKIITLLEGTK